MSVNFWLESSLISEQVILLLPGVLLCEHWQYFLCGSSMVQLHCGYSQRSCRSWCSRSPVGRPRAPGYQLDPALRSGRWWNGPSYSPLERPGTCCSLPVEEKERNTRKRKKTWVEKYRGSYTHGTQSPFQQPNQPQCSAEEVEPEEGWNSYERKRGGFLTTGRTQAETGTNWHSILITVTWGLWGTFEWSGADERAEVGGGGGAVGWRDDEALQRALICWNLSDRTSHSALQCLWLIQSPENSLRVQ